MKSAKIYMYDRYAGLLTEDENGFSFVYDADYLQRSDVEPISLTTVSYTHLTLPTRMPV